MIHVTDEAITVDRRPDVVGLDSAGAELGRSQTVKA